ncbi:carboxylesterase/lipase family protein [Variovorax sp. PvP013]|uniref:carboxylesterase/lipase family protein n=1 Tax=Variovorax sp. PvP013 TaxID=3156435 RepID=UPI003D25989B
MALCTLPLLLSACGGGGDHDGPPANPLVRTTHLGAVVGAKADASGTYAWKGIPYARPPVGDLRWRPPQEPTAWTDARAATSFGNACTQYGRIYGPGTNNRYDATIGVTLNQAVGSEDCLYLNIWRPATEDGNLPVIVFLHGGSNVSGYTADPMWDGAALAKAANAVVVTPNFRLGIFGFLDAAPLKSGDVQADSGNFTLLDSIKALQFVRANAQVFGGDAGNVTLVGHSAGANNVWALQSSPIMAGAATKLFHRIMPMSYGISLPSNLPAGSIATLNPASTYTAQGRELLQQQLIADGLAADAASAGAYVRTRSDAEMAAYLRSRTPTQLFSTLLTRLAPLGLAASGPIPDGSVVAADPIAAIGQGRYVQVPVLASTTREEGKLFPSFLPRVGGTVNGRIVTDAQLFANHFSYDPDGPARTTVEQWIAPAYLPVDAPTTGFTARSLVLTETFLERSRDNVLNALRAKQPSVWYYRFDWDEQPAPWNQIYGAAHAADVPFLFGNFGPSLFSNVWFSEANRAGRVALSDAMMRSLASFARHGDPNHAGLGTTWRTWPGKLIFDATPIAPAIRTE